MAYTKIMESKYKLGMTVEHKGRTHIIDDIEWQGQHPNYYEKLHLIDTVSGTKTKVLPKITGNPVTIVGGDEVQAKTPADYEYKVGDNVMHWGAAWRVNNAEKVLRHGAYYQRLIMGCMEQKRFPRLPQTTIVHTKDARPTLIVGGFEKPHPTMTIHHPKKKKK